MLYRMKGHKFQPKIQTLVESFPRRVKDVIAAKMSFVRINRRPGRTKKTSVPKKEWVSTVTDLSVHKATAEDLYRRHEMHRSHNRALAQWELKEKGQKRLQKRSQMSSPSGLDKARLRIIREVFSDQCQLQDVLARSDRAMAVVKDLFGDAPRRQTGFPNVTKAPGCDSDSELPVLERPDPPTQLSLLSQSVMDQQALNELNESAGEQEEEQDISISYSSEMCRPKRKMSKARPPQWSRDQQVKQQNLPQTPCNAAGSGDQAALNATVAVERLKSRQSQSDTGQSGTLVTQAPDPEPASSCSGGKSRSSRINGGRSPGPSRLDSSGFSSQSANLSSLELLQDMLGQVETDLACLEPHGSLGSFEPPKHHRGLTGFSVSLVACLGRIVSHMRQREEEVLKEAQVRKRLEEQVREQRDLIDALTAECLSLRDESAALQVGLQEQINKVEQRLRMVILGEMGGRKEERELGPQDGKVLSVDAKPVPTEKRTEKQASDPPAVLLSPPRQRDSRAPPTAARSRSLHFGDSHATASICSLEDSDPSSTPCSFVSLPDRVLPRPAPLLDQASQDAMLQQIAELTQQNTVIQARLGQSRPSPAGASVSRQLGADCLSTAGTKDKPPSPSTGQQPTQQRVDDSSMRLLEERLQELNRQSAAAREKLLELIEQQKRTTSVSVSPSISPIPPHTISPSTAAVRLDPGSCVSVSEQSFPSIANSRRSPGAVSLQSVQGGERRAINTQGNKVNGEGWFALSAHIR